MPGSRAIPIMAVTRTAVTSVAVASVAVASVAVASVAVAGTALAAIAVLGSGRAGAAQDPRAVQRVLVLSLPGTTWADVAGPATPHLREFFDHAALASLSVRTIERETRPGDGYATVGAGTAAAGVAADEGLAFNAAESPEGLPEPVSARLRTERQPEGRITSLAIRSLQRDARTRHRGAEIGILGETLARAGVDRAVFANADRGGPGLEPSLHREAALALVDRRGSVPSGEVGRTLLRPDREASFGVGLDGDAVLAAFGPVWDAPGQRVALVEASDLARNNAVPVAIGRVGAEERRRRALGSADALAARLLALVDPARDAVIVISPSDPADGVHLTVAALRAPRVDGGLLTSATTRRAGYVTLPDVGPTVLDLLGVPRPDSMEGRPFAITHRSGHPGAGGAPFARFTEADREARFRDRLQGPVAGFWVTLQILLSLATALLLARSPAASGRRRALRLVALWLLAFVPLTFLTSVLDVATTPAFILFAGGGAVLVAMAADRLPPLWPATVLLGLLLSLQVGDVATGSHLQISTVFGYSPTVGGRFSGFGNLAFGQVAPAAILLAALVAHLVRGWRGAKAGIAVLAVALVADGLPAWGADVGGVLASVPAFSLVALGLAGIRLSWRRLLALGVAAVGAVAGLGFVDLLRPAGQRTHLGRLFEQIGHDGLRPLSDAVQRKVAANLDVLPTSVWVPLVIGMVVFLAWLAWGPSAQLERIRTAVPELRPALVGVLVVAVLGFALNDSGIAVPAMILGILNPVVVDVALR